MTTIQFQLEVESRRPQTLTDGDPPTELEVDDYRASTVIQEDYDYPFIIAAVPLRGRRGLKGDTGDAGPMPTPFTETLDGTQDGVNLDYVLTHDPVPQSLMVFRNGLLEVSGIGYTLVGDALTFTTAPLEDDLITVTYYIQP